MNKELEEAKQKLEKFVGLFYEFPNPTSISIRDYEVGAIETVLNYIENSIQKESTLNKEYIDNIPEGQLIGITKLQYKEYLYLRENSIPKKKVEELKEEITLPNIIVGGRRNCKTLEYGKKLGKLEVLKELLEVE